MSGTWQPNPRYEEQDRLIDDDGVVLAVVEQFYDDGPAYPTAIDARTGLLERGGPMNCPVEARLWAERVAGLHPRQEGDDRPPFYHD